MIFDKMERDRDEVEETTLRPTRPPLTQGIYLGFFTSNALLLTNTFDNRERLNDSPPIVSRSLKGLFDRC